VSAPPEFSQNFFTFLFYLACKMKALAEARAIRVYPCESVAYFFAASPTLAYFRRKRSTRPAVSISFCLPVKKG